MTKTKTVALIFLSLFFAAVCTITLLHIAKSPASNWDPNAWENCGGLDNTRPPIAEGLLKHRSLNGMTRSNAINMLGNPTTGKQFPGWDTAYWLGPERGYISIDSEWLAIQFDQNNNVSKASIIRD